MTDTASTGAVVLVGCGRLGSAILEGWLATGTVAPADLIILTPSEKPAAETARGQGARVNPPAEALARARALVLAVKPAYWREALEPLVAAVPNETPIVSVMAGVKAGDIAAVSGRPVARVMPTTAVAQGRGVAALWSADAEARGGLDFPGKDEPGAHDFLYFAFVIGMTAQTSDVAITSTAMRKANLLHAVVSFFFNTVLVAAAVNVAVSLAG